jgi:hypothetical protein
MAKTPLKPTHKRRTEDELRKALAIVESHKDTLHVNADDEHVDVLADAVTELLATRQIIVKLMQQIGTMEQEAYASLKSIVP